MPAGGSLDPTQPVRDAPATPRGVAASVESPGEADNHASQRGCPTHDPSDARRPTSPLRGIPSTPRTWGRVRVDDESSPQDPRPQGGQRAPGGEHSGAKTLVPDHETSQTSNFQSLVCGLSWAGGAPSPSAS